MDFDPEELCERVESGEDERVTMKRGDVGPRGHEAVAEIRRRMERSLSGD